MIKHQELSDPESCLNKAGYDELIFVLRSKDTAAVAAVRAWIHARVTSGQNKYSDPKIQSAEDWLYQCALGSPPPSSVNAKEPPPQASPYPAVWDLVKADMAERDAMGEKKYGVRLQPHNGRDGLVDLFQELLDALVYCRGLIYERDGR